MQSNHHLMNVYNRFQVNFTHGNGIFLYDNHNNEYLDAGAGIAVNSFGHCHPDIIKVLADQSKKLWHISNLYTSDIQLKFAELLCANSFADNVFFTNSGAEAIECALKVARRYHHHHGATRKREIITFKGAFHGRTHLCISAAGTQDNDGFGTMSPDFDIIEGGDISLIEKHICEKTAAIMLEPILGEGGIKIHSAEYLQKIRQLCDRHDVLMICDEVQSGMGRTGKLFAFEHSNIIPDICTSAKGIGAGFPLGACLATNKAAIGMVHGTHGSTYGGNPLACAVGNKVVELILEDDFLSKITIIGNYLTEQLGNLQKDFLNIIDNIRGKGLMIGIKLNDSFSARNMAAHLLAHGLIVIPAADNVIRILPPLIITKKDCDLLLKKMKLAFEAL